MQTFSLFKHVEENKVIGKIHLGVNFIRRK